MSNNVHKDAYKNFLKNTKTDWYTSTTSNELVDQGNGRLRQHAAGEFWRHPHGLGPFYAANLLYTVLTLSWRQCYVEFDESEVVMNHHIVPVHKSAPVWRLQVRPKKWDDPGAWMPDASDTPNVTVQAGTVYEARVLIVEEETEKDDDDYTEEHPFYQFSLQLGEGGLFTKGQCQQKRAWGWGNWEKDTATLPTFTVESATTLVGAWAVGHSAVSLTPILELLLEPKARDTSPEL